MDKRTEKAFLGKARHNLKNPVNAILGYSEMLIEDCEDEGLDHLISDIEKLQSSGKEILLSIDENFDDKVLNDPSKTIASIGKKMELAISTPLNTIIGYSALLIDEGEDVPIDNFSSDIEKIAESGRLLENELRTIIEFNVEDIGGIRKQNLNLGNYSMVQDVMESIEPLDKSDKMPEVVGTILAVDDNKNNTELLKKRLEKKGHTVFTSNDGREALIQLMTQEDGIDVILLDIVMPEMNGYEVLKFIKNDKRYHELPVIMISSMDDTDSIYRCIEIGADDYITKPFEKSILDARITSCIERKQLRDKEKILMLELQQERNKSEHLLLNILPADIAERLKSGETDIATKHDNITILFSDLVNFTPQAQDLSPNRVVHILNKIFKSFDDLAVKHNIEKIKTIGDSYFAVGGLQTDQIQAAKNVIEFSIEMLETISRIDKNTTEMELKIRIGVHTGPVVAGVIGKNKFAYDLWGASVNMANRLETTCPPGNIQISEYTKNILGDVYNYNLKEKTNIKGIGQVNTYIIV